MSSVKQLFGFPHLHSAAQHSRHEDMRMPISLSEDLSLLSFLHTIPIFPQQFQSILPQQLPSPPVPRASGYQREMFRVTWASSVNATAAAPLITHRSCRAPAAQAASMRSSPGDGHSCTPAKGRQSMAEAWCKLYPYHAWRSATVP